MNECSNRFVNVNVAGNTLIRRCLHIAMAVFAVGLLLPDRALAQSELIGVSDAFPVIESHVWMFDNKPDVKQKRFYLVAFSDWPQMNQGKMMKLADRFPSDLGVIIMFIPEQRIATGVRLMEKDDSQKRGGYDEGKMKRVYVGTSKKMWADSGLDVSDKDTFYLVDINNKIVETGKLKSIDTDMIQNHMAKQTNPIFNRHSDALTPIVGELPKLSRFQSTKDLIKTLKSAKSNKELKQQAAGILSDIHETNKESVADAKEKAEAGGMYAAFQILDRLNADFKSEPYVKEVSMLYKSLKKDKAVKVEISAMKSWDKVAGSILKNGTTSGSKDCKRVVSKLEKLVDKYPGTQAMELASSKIQELQRN